MSDGDFRNAVRKPARRSRPLRLEDDLMALTVDKGGAAADVLHVHFVPFTCLVTPGPCSQSPEAGRRSVGPTAGPAGLVLFSLSKVRRKGRWGDQEKLLSVRLKENQHQFVRTPAEFSSQHCPLGPPSAARDNVHARPRQGGWHPPLSVRLR